MPYTCPQGHSEELQQCFRIYIWAPVDTSLGEAKIDDLALSDCEEDEGEWEARQYYCPTCNDCFDTLENTENTSNAMR